MISCTIQLISETTSQQAYITLHLWKALEEDIIDKQPLIQVAVWAIGEYGDLLIQGAIDDSEDIRRPTEDEIVDVYERLMRTPQNTPTTKQYTLMSLTKLSTRFSNIKYVKSMTIFFWYFCYYHISF